MLKFVIPPSLSTRHFFISTFVQLAGGLFMTMGRFNSMLWTSLNLSSFKIKPTLQLCQIKVNSLIHPQGSLNFFKIHNFLTRKFVFINLSLLYWICRKSRCVRISHYSTLAKKSLKHWRQRKINNILYTVARRKLFQSSIFTVI
jgi:hypothetical protein